MTWTLVASGRGVDSVTLNTTGANFLIASFGTAALGSIASWDNKGNTWVKLTEYSIGTYRMTLAYCLSPSAVGAAHTITDPNAGIEDYELHFYAFTAPATPTFGSENGSNDATFGGNNTKSSGFAGSLSVTPLANDALIFAAVGNLTGSGTTSAYSVNSSFTLGQSQAAGTVLAGGALLVSLQQRQRQQRELSSVVQHSEVNSERNQCSLNSHQRKR